jgi:ABC-2 type transport system ATP-binding protein
VQARGASVTRNGDGTLAVTGATTDAIGELARANGITLAELSAQQASLEERYMELTRDTADYRSAAPAAAAAADGK